MDAVISQIIELENVKWEYGIIIMNILKQSQNILLCILIVIGSQINKRTMIWNKSIYEAILKLLKSLSCYFEPGVLFNLKIMKYIFEGEEYLYQIV